MSEAPPQISPEDAEEYTQALGQVVAGGYRQVALGKRLGVPQALGLTVEDWVQSRLGGYVRLSIPERREAVAELVEEGMSNAAVAEVLGVDEKTVRRDRNSANAETAAPTSALPLPSQDPISANAEAADQQDLEATEPVDLFSDETLVVVETDDDRLAAQERDARLLSHVTKAIAAAGPLATALPAVEQMLGRLDRDRLASLGPRVEGTAEILSTLAKRARELQENRPRLVQGGRR